MLKSYYIQAQKRLYTGLNAQKLLYTGLNVQKLSYNTGLNAQKILYAGLNAQKLLYTGLMGLDRVGWASEHCFAVLIILVKSMVFLLKNYPWGVSGVS